MNTATPSLPAKILAAALGFALMAVVPLLTVHYAAHAHAADASLGENSAVCAAMCPVAHRNCADAERCCTATSCAATGLCQKPANP